jgi:uncharacterized membrane protein YkoI
MAMTRSLPLLAMLLALACAGAPASHAQEPGGPHRGRGAERAHAERAISLDEAVARAERHYQARAVRAEEKRRGDRVENRIRLRADDGRVFEVRVDAATGRED